MAKKKETSLFQDLEDLLSVPLFDFSDSESEEDASEETEIPEVANEPKSKPVRTIQTFNDGEPKKKEKKPPEGTGAGTGTGNDAE